MPHLYYANIAGKEKAFKVSPKNVPSAQKAGLSQKKAPQASLAVHVERDNTPHPPKIHA